ncbi:reverse transcriptase domain-containing protein [Tanacetum coccineum]
MVTPVEKRSSNKFCDIHNDKGHSTDECMQLKKQIEELVRAGKLSHLIKEIKQGRDQPKVGKKEVPAKDKSIEIYMVQLWHRMTRQKVTQSFARVSEITFPPLTTRDAEHSTKTWMNFMIVRSLSPYNGIIGRLGIREIQAVPSTANGMLKFLVDGGIVTIRSIILIPAECATVTTSSKEILKEAKVRHGNFNVALHWNFPDQEPSDMTGIPRSVAEHWLNIQEGYSPVRQKKRGQAPERAKAIQSEDCYPLSEIDWKVESLCGYPFKCFLDTYKGYHQIQMAESDEEKTAFHTSHGVYCYTKMPFSLKNVGATYQRLVDKAFDNQVGRNIEVYVDDLVIKSHTEIEMLRDVDETFRTLRKINMKLNPKKCTFGAVEGMFLGYMISPEGIKPRPNKTEASAEKSLPLFKTLKKCIKKSDFHWTPEAEQAFKQLKQHLSKLPMLVAPTPKEELIVYLSASYGAISAVLMTKKDKILAGFLIEKPDEAPPDTPEGTEFTYALRFQFTASNNEAEYEALIAGLRIAAQIGVRNVHVSVDSKLVANQVLGTYVAKEENMIKYLKKAKSLVLVEVLKEKSIQEKEVTTVVKEDGPTWMTPIMEYLKDGTLSENRKETSKLRIKARQYELLEGVLYRRSFLKPWLRCVGPLQSDYVIQEIHEGSCRIDIAGPFPKGPRKVKFFIVAVDYFMKWIEAKVMAEITGSQVKKFVWENIVCRFGLSGEIVSDNGKQFSDNPLKDWCEKLNITQRFASVKHPQYNGLVKRANRSLGEETKARLGVGNKNWIKELPHVLWAHRTMIKSSHVDAVHNDEELRLNLDLLEERRERATIGEAKAKLKMTKYYNARVRGVTFRPGDFVYRSNDVDGGKLGPKWEGPYEVMEALRDGTHAKVYGWNSPSADVEHHQSQEMLSLSNGMDEFAL